MPDAKADANAAPDWERFDDEGFIDLVGPLFSRREASGLRAFALTAEQKHANLIGLVHGGMLMTLADRALGVAAWDAAGGLPCVTVQFDMQFLSSVKLGEFVTLSPVLVRKTRSLVFLRGVLEVGGREVAAATGIWKILEKR